MSLTQTQTQLLANVRQFSGTAGSGATARNPDATVNDYINRALGSFYRRLTEVMPDQRFLSTSTVTTINGTSTYSLPADFDHLISVDLTANGVKSWLTAYDMNERPLLTDPSTSYTGIPFAYRLRGSNIELLPTPGAVYSSTLWYVPAVTQLSSGGETFDTISRLDDYIIAYASRLIAIKEKNWDLVNVCKSICDELNDEIQAIARSRDKNSPPRPVDERIYNRWGRRSGIPGRWR